MTDASTTLPAGPDEELLLQIAKGELSKILSFAPYKNYPGVRDREQFRRLIGSDPAFDFLGLDDERYAVARIGGNLVTSLHRKIGDMYESLVQAILTSRFELSRVESKYSVTVQIGRRKQIRSTDGFVPTDRLAGRTLPKLPAGWESSQGVGLELRSCYQIGDSKRIQADYDMALALAEQDIVPVMIVFCATSLRSPTARLAKQWSLFQGVDAFDFLREMTDFDLRGFLTRNSPEFKAIISRVLDRI